MALFTVKVVNVIAAFDILVYSVITHCCPGQV